MATPVKSGRALIAQGHATRGRQMLQMLAMLRALSRGWRTADDLAAELGMHRRVVYRCLAGLRKAGLELQHETVWRAAYWHLPRRTIETWLGPYDSRLPAPAPEAFCWCGKRVAGRGLCSLHYQQARHSARQLLKRA